MTVTDPSSGTLGFFWKIGLGDAPDLESDPERGYVTFQGGWAVLDVLDENPWDSEVDQGDEPAALVGIMPEDAALFLEVHESGATRRFGGPRASSRRYLARTVIGHAPVDRIRTTSLLELHAHFHGIGRWAGMTAATEDRQTTKDGLLRSWSVTLGGGEDFSYKLPSGRTLVLSATWRVDGPLDRRVMSAPVSIGCTSRKPVEMWELLQPVLHVQDLLDFAFWGFVAADGGSARLDLGSTKDQRYSSKPSLWNGALMVGHPGVPPPKSTGFPLIDLPALGGIAGLARWIRLSLKHPRATGPVVAPYRHGPASLAVTVMELAAGIEYWVKANQPAAWASTKLYAQAIANRCGKAFSDWVGSTELWGSAFWDANNHLKHEQSYVADPMELADLAESARYLLGAVLLNRAAGSSAPSRAIFRHHRLADLGSRLRKLYK